jgi:hypothetical protein
MNGKDTKNIVVLAAVLGCVLCFLLGYFTGAASTGVHLDTYECVEVCGINVPSAQVFRDEGGLASNLPERQCFCYAGPVPRPRVEP